MSLACTPLMVHFFFRVPRVQELLVERLGRELGKSLNTDEAAAMGAVYKAADLSTGFKVCRLL